MTATATKTKKQAETAELLLIPLTSIVSNVGQSRGMGVLSTLQQLGYGLFEKLPDFPDNEPIWPRLVSDNPDERVAAADLIAENEDSVLNLAGALKIEGQLEPIGVNAKGDNYNVIFGMRRCIALAYNRARDTKQTGFVEAKVFKAQSETEQRFVALSENDNREDHSPIDRALTYQWLKTDKAKGGGGLEVVEIAARMDLDKVTVHQYLRLLDPKIEDLRIRLHNREISVEKAIKILQRRKESGDAKADDGRESKDERARKRFPRVKTIKEYYDGKLPEDMKPELRDLYAEPSVRKFLSLYLGFRLTEFKDRSKPKAEESNGDGKDSIQTWELPRSLANKILVCCGHTNAATWEDSTVITKLENAPGLGDADATLEDEKAQKWYNAFHKHYANGYKIKIAKTKKK